MRPPYPYTDWADWFWESAQSALGIACLAIILFAALSAAPSIGG